MTDTQKSNYNGEGIMDRLKLCLTPFHDGRYEDMRTGWKRAVFRDFTSGLIVAMVAIPLAMGFAIASGLNPIHGIVGGAFAGFIGSLFGGSKYQVYGPTAAYIPIIFGVMVTFGGDGNQILPEQYATGYGVLIFCSVCAGLILVCMGLLGLGRFVAKVPHSIVVGFTIGIALTIALTQLGDVLGLSTKLPYSLTEKFPIIAANLDEFNIFALLLTVGTFLITKYLLKISIYIPGPLIAIGLGYVLSETLLNNQGLTVAQDKYGAIPITDFFKFTAPIVPEFSLSVTFDVLFYISAIVFVAAIESLLCSRMADRLADNQGTPYNPNKELFGQGMVNTIVPLLNGFPHTGALARTATNIKVGGMTPLAGILKCWLKLAMAFFLAAYLDFVPMACIAGILAYVAFNMVKLEEIKLVHAMNWFHISLMYYTAVVVLLKDFLTGVLSALIIYALLHRFFDKPSISADVDAIRPAADPEQESLTKKDST
ncbi:MAG: SulP family inorganic anion transporter [Methylococcales bacterium]